MKRRRLIIIAACACCLALTFCADIATAGEGKAAKPQTVLATDREVVEALLKRSRLLENVHFRVPRRLWAQYVRSHDAPKASPAPVAAIAQDGLYRLTVDAEGAVTLNAEIHLRVFNPPAVANRAVLAGNLAWTDVRVALNGAKPAPIDLAASKGWMRYSPAAPGLHVIHAQTKLSRRHSETLALAVTQTVRTRVDFDSGALLHVTDPSAPQSITGAQGKGTHGELALKQTTRLDVTYRPPVVLTEREARYQLSGPVAWNIDADGQDVTAKLNVAILAGRTDRIDLTLPPGATRPTVTSPDVRETRVTGAGVTVHLRGRITGKTTLTVKFALPPAGQDAASLAGLGVDNGRWAGGTLVVTNSAGSTAVMPDSATGLTELALADIPRDAAAILKGRTSLVYTISAGSWSAAVETVNLGEFALRETLADLAHYEIVYRGDGSVICKADYEIRNRNRQFLALTLPPGAKVLLARVNEKSRPLTPAPQLDTYLLPLVRSKASVIGLVSFPVEVVFVYRAAPLKASGEAAIDLPRIDVPIAYAWCEAYLPETMAVKRWGGPLKRVDRYSSETATASMDYGRSELAEGYKRGDRFTPRVPVEPVKEPDGPAEAKKDPRVTGNADFGPDNGRGGGGGGGGGRITMPRRIGLQGMTGRGGGRRVGNQSMSGGGNSMTPLGVVGGNSVTPLGINGGATLSLGRNYYRSGKEQYEGGNLEGAERALENTIRLSPDSNEAVNAKRLLSNIKLAQGKLALKTKSEKASSSQVYGDIMAGNQLLVDRQKKTIEKGFKSIREGKRGEALKQFQAAEALNEQLLSQGEKKSEQDALLRKSRALLEKAQTEQRSKTERYLEQITGLRQKGDYAKAASVARKGLADTDGDGPGDEGTLQRQLDQLTVLQAGKDARKNRFKGGEPGKGEGGKLGDEQLQAELRRIESTTRAYRERQADTMANLEAAQAREMIASHRRAVPNIHTIVRGGAWAGATASLNGTVLAVQNNIASINAGSAKGVRPGMKLVVYRGDKLVGFLKIREVNAQESAGVLEEMVLFARSGDKVTAQNAQINQKGQSPLAKKRCQLEYARIARPERIAREKQRKLDTLTNLARTLISQGEYKQANDELERIIAIEPNHSWALDQRETLGNLIVMLDEKQIVDGSMLQQQQSTLVDRRRSETPWWEQVRYPDNWKDVGTHRRQVAAGGTLVTTQPAGPRGGQADGQPGGMQRRLPKVDFANVPLEQVIESLRKTSGVNFYVNWRALQVASVDKTTEVNVHLTDVTLEKAIATILDDVSGPSVGTPTQVDMVNDNGVYRITTREALSHETITRVYDIRDILIPTPTINMPRRIGLQGMSNQGNRRGGGGGGGGIGGGGLIGGGETESNFNDNIIHEDEAGQSQEELLAQTVDLIKDTIARDTWDGGASIRPMGGQLVVTQTRENHEALLGLISQLREASAPGIQREEEELRHDSGRSDDRPAAQQPPARPRSDTERRLAQSLPKIDFANVPFELVVQFLRETSGLAITVDWKALAVASVNKTTEVNVHLVNASLARTVQLVLNDVSGPALGTPDGIVHILDGNTMLITTTAAMSRRISTKTHDIRDLISAVQPERRRAFVEELVDTVKNTVVRDTWDASDKINIRSLNGTLVVTHNPHAQNAVAKLLADYRAPITARDATRRSPPRDDGADAASLNTKRLLSQPLPKLDFANVPLELVIQFMREVSGVSIYVNWRALQVAAVDKTTEVNLPRQTNITIGQALQAVLDDVSGAAKGTPTQLDFIIDNGVIRITTREALSHRTVTRVYNLREITKNLPKNTVEDIETESNFNSNLNNGMIGGGLDSNRVQTRDEFTDEVVELIKESVSRDSWEQGASARLVGDQLVISNTIEAQEAVDALIKSLGSVKRRQIQEGQSLSLQRADDKAKPQTTDEDADRLTKDKEFQNFLDRNYAWQRQGDPQTQRQGQIDVDKITAKLKWNQGQKVQVGSININAAAEAAASLGIRFNRGNNNVIYTTIDEAQFRTLMEIDVKNRSGGRNLNVAANPNKQDTIVGTDALLSNDFSANITYSADKGNTIDVYDNPVNLRHDDYILIANDGYLTAVRAGQMVHWQDKTKAIEFVETPQNIDVPRAGRLVRFEKTLIRPTDRLVIRATYTREGK